MPTPNRSLARGIDQVWFTLPWIGLLVGTILVGSAFRHPTIPGSITPVARFWIGLTFFYLPTSWRLLSMSAGRSERALLLAVTALFSLLPRILTCPDYFCTYEELGWWRAVQNLAAGSGILASAPLGAAQGAYPALPVVTFLLQQTAGLSTFHTGLILSILFRVFIVLGVFALGERIFLSTRAGTAAALVLFLYPGFYQAPGFTSDRMGLALLVPALLVAVYVAEREDETRTPSWYLLALIFMITIALTHPSTAFMLAIILAGMALSTYLPPAYSDHSAALRLVKIAGLALLVAVTWLLAASASTLPDQIAWLRSVWAQIQAGEPGFELANSPYLLPASVSVLFIILILAGAHLIRKLGLPVLPASNGLFLITAILLSGVAAIKLRGVASTPAVHTALFTGLALLAGLAVAWITAPKHLGERRLIRAGRQVLPLLIFAVVLASISIPSAQTFQTSNAGGSQPTFTTENVAAAEWMLDQAGPGNRILGDEASLRVFGSLGMQDPVWQADPRAWKALSTVSNPLQTLLWLSVSDAPYLVLDRRQNDILDLSSTLASGHPAGLPAASPIAHNAPAAEVDSAPLLARVYDSGQVRIYYLPLGSIPDRASVLPLDQPLTGSTSKAPTHLSAIGFARTWLALWVLMFLPGFLLCVVLFPKWGDVDGLTRLILSFISSICMITLLGVIGGLLLPGSTGSTELIWIATFVLAALALHTQGPVNFRNWLPMNSLPRLRLSRSYLPALAMAAGGAVIAVALLSWTSPSIIPVTRFALDLRSPLRVQIANHEGGTIRYFLVARTGGEQVWQSGPLEVGAGEEINLDLDQVIPLSPGGSRIDLLLYREGQNEPYRSLHLLVNGPDQRSHILQPNPAPSGN